MVLWNLGRIRRGSSLPPLGEVPRSGKGGAAGNFEPLPFNEPHPLSQPCRFRRAVKSASSPTGEPRPLLPPLGEVPRSGKGGAVGHFELLPFIEQHPLSLALLDSSPIGEPSGLLRIRPRFHRTITTYRETPQSALTGCQLPFQGRFFSLPPLGEVPRSGKGGVVGSFKLLPFNKPHPPLCDSLRAA